MPGCWVDNAIRYRRVRSELITDMRSNTDQNMLVPMPVSGTKSTLPVYQEYEWISKLPDKKIFLALFQRHADQLPYGYDYYIVSFHLEVVDLDWLRRQNVSGQIIVLFDGNHYDCNLPNVEFIPYFYWHRQLARIIEWFGIQPKSSPQYKFSAVCNRITQSKVWITTKLLESAGDDSLIILANWLEIKNVHGWQPTGNHVLDSLSQIFIEKYQGHEIKIDQFDNSQHNVQNYTANPWQPLYQNCAINFTNESFHYSHMQEKEQYYVWPGPFITEKTLKCLAGASAFVPVGQFQTYHTLQDLGFVFDYGFGIDWDLDAGNLSRCQKIIELIDQLNQFSAEQLASMTQDSNMYNQNHIVTGNFGKLCRQRNEQAVEQIFSKII